MAAADTETSIVLVAGSKKLITMAQKGKWIVTNNGFTYSANFVIVNEASHIYGSHITTYGKVTLYQ